MTTDARPSVRVTHQFAASPERVFDAWITPEKVGKWMLGPAGGEMLRIEVDARVGGRFSFFVRRGDQEIDHVGEYLVFERPHRLSFTWEVPAFSSESSTVHLELEPVDGGTLLTLTHEGVQPEYGAQTQRGWSMILQAIAASLA